MKTIQKSDYFKVALDAIIVEKDFNVREDLEGLDELAKSIATIGQETPIEGYKVRGEDKFVLNKGHRRVAATHIANEKYIGKPGYLEKPITHMNLMAGSSDEKQRVIGMLLDGEASRPLSNKEMIKGINRLLAMDVPQKEIVQSLSLTKSVAQAYNLIAAAKTPKAVQALIDQGLISSAKVNSLQRKAKKSGELLIDLVENFVENGDEPKVKKTSVIEKLEAVLESADKTTVKGAFLKALVNKLNADASVEDIAKLLK